MHGYRIIIILIVHLHPCYKIMSIRLPIINVYAKMIHIHLSICDMSLIFDINT